MPHIPPGPPPPVHWPMQLWKADGQGARDFYALANNMEYDETFADANPATYDSPTSRFTHVLHYLDGRIARVFLVPDWLTALWWSRTAGKGYTVGFPRGALEFDATGITELIFDCHEGTFSALWGSGEAHLFACGYLPFALHRNDGVWQHLALPAGCTDLLHDIGGSSETEVYFVGADGTLLYFDGISVQAMEVDTTRHLYCIAPLAGGLFCIGGASGLLLMGNHAGFRVVPSGVDDNIESIAHFDGSVYFLSEDRLHAFDGKASPRTVLRQQFESVATLGDALLLQDGTDAWLYDGRQLVPLATTV